MISRPRPPLFLEGRSGGWAARAALPLGARGGRRGGRRYFSFRASAALREEAEERLRGVDLARRVVLQGEVDGRVAADGAARRVVGLGGLALVLEDAEVLRAAAVVLLRVLDLREPLAAVRAHAAVLAALGRQVALRRRALVLGEVAPGNEFSSVSRSESPPDAESHQACLPSSRARASYARAAEISSSKLPRNCWPKLPMPAWPICALNLPPGRFVTYQVRRRRISSHLL